MIFEAPASVEEKDLSTKIEAGLAGALGYEVPVFLRSCAQVAEIAARKPFNAGQLKASAGKLQVAMLPDAPGRARAGRALARWRRRTTGSRSRAASSSGCRSGGVSDSDLDLKTLEAALGPWTIRTMGTVEQIAAKHCA